MPGLIWSAAAERDIDAVEEYISADNPAAALEVRDTIEAATKRLKTHPRLGRVGRVRGTRELVVAGLPYVVIYRATIETVAILRVLHGAQQWPPRA